MDKLISMLQLCLGSDVKRVLIPSTSFVDFATVPLDLMNTYQLIPYQSAEDATFKAWGVEHSVKPVSILLTHRKNDYTMATKGD